MAINRHRRRLVPSTRRVCGEQNIISSVFLSSVIRAASLIFSPFFPVMSAIHRYFSQSYRLIFRKHILVSYTSPNNCLSLKLIHIRCVYETL